ncbi:NAD(P)/FAD-dependent oxidoreductase [Amycolatopsis samaneae]|uniref:NAD(P)/FAD-dependent oxidoreductase n=1 Tax=Amycolatopsis samaneae TaxID=664691 RepID=A0ABW5GXE1_9PSEU
MNRADIAVVGGGIVGAVVTHELAAAYPGADIVVLERGLAGLGASSRSAGVHFPRGATERVRAMTAYSHRYWRELAAELDLPLRAIDAVVVAPADRRDAVRTIYIRLGRETTAADPARGRPAPIGMTAWTLPGCHYADVGAVAQRILTTLRGRVAVWEGSEVVTLQRGEDTCLVLRHGAELRARRVVLCPGPWIAHPAWAKLLAPLDLRVKKIVAAHLEAVPDEDHPLTVFHDEDAFLLPVHHRGHLLFSYTCDVWDVSPDTVAPGLGPADLDDARTVLARYAPELAERCRSGRAFCDAYSPQREPVVAELGPGLVFAGAAGGSGYRLAPAIAADTLARLDSASAIPSLQRLPRR